MLKTTRAKGVTALIFADGASFSTRKLDDQGNELERIIIDLTPQDLEDLAAAYAHIKRTQIRTNCVGFGC